jgi:hypothetical protein
MTLHCPFIVIRTLKDQEAVDLSVRPRISVADPDPGSGAFLIPGTGIWDGHKNNFLVAILKFFDADPGSGK